MKKIIAVIVFLIMVTPVTQAQDEVGVCGYFYGESRLMTEATVTFPACANILLAFSQNDVSGEAYGWWDTYYVSVLDSGDVYYASSERNPEWIYWGNILPVSSPPVPSPTPEATDNPMDDRWVIEDLVNVAAHDINDFWITLFDENNLRYQVPTIYLDNYNRLLTACGMVSSRQGPLYCSLENTIYLPQNFMEVAQSRIGDFAVVVIIAHEWGHHIQSQLGILHNVDYLTSLTPERRNIEIEADCLAGAYTAHAASASENVSLDDGDLEEGAIQMFEVGSDLSEIEVWTNPRAHGRPEDRVEAYETGFYGGVESCLR